MEHVLVTGGAGFIGSHLVDLLLEEGLKVTVIDNFDPFYDPQVKWKNIEAHRENPNFKLVEGDICDSKCLDNMAGDFDAIAHLAAKAGVRPSILDPVKYQEVNVMGTQNLLEAARKWGVKQFVFASSSSVYGVNPHVPWKESGNVLLPISPYASTKVSGELMGYVYTRLYGIRFIALRFFTVYGPRQRPDLAIHKFTRLMLDGKEIPVFGDGSMSRDFTFVADTISGVRAALDYSKTDFEVINLGNNQTVSLKKMVAGIEDALNLKAKIDWQPEQPGDVPQTYADITKGKQLLGYAPQTSFKDGLQEFVKWLS